MTDPIHRRSWLSMTLVALAAALLLATAAAAQDASPGSEAGPSASQPVLPGEPNPPWDDGAVPAVVDPTLVNPHPRPWANVLVAPDGRTLDVYFWNGAPECAGLARVDVTQSDGKVAIEIWTGDVPDVVPCVTSAQLYRTTVVLDSRAVTGGSILDMPGG